MIDETAHMERGPADAVVAAPAGAIKGAYIEVVRASANLERGRGQLRGGDLNQGTRLRDAVDNEVTDARRSVIELISGDCVVVGIGDAEQRGRAQHRADR